MGLRFHSSDSCLPTSSSPVVGAGGGIEDSTSDLDSPSEAYLSSTRSFPQRANIDINHNPKAKHSQHPFKWSTCRRKAHEHWLWSGNYYWSHHDPSKQAPFRIRPHQVRTIVHSKAIGPKQARVKPFVRTWTKRNLVKSRKQDLKQSWKELTESGVKVYRDREEAQLPFERERERERSESRQQRRRPPSLERQDAFWDKETCKRRREVRRRGGLSREMGEEDNVDDKIRVIGYGRAMYEKQIYEATARGEIAWSQMAQDSEAGELDLEALYERELTRLYQNRLRTDLRRFVATRSLERATCKQQERTGQQIAWNMNLEFSASVEELMALLSSHNGISTIQTCTCRKLCPERQLPD
ncbi:hypothetical protein QBC36DRAFT_87788 [Triangularia setosa]|uniref:Uncharacterized protein n=1 Tax=Triangularia setosa TaxID=2587417 RepID=A0AAN7A1G0_9PEZI|nr:hypothetical protein QBC36DRAFT_87788 [Podospora setosa]